jgi:hypothetical protein
MELLISNFLTTTNLLSVNYALGLSDQWLLRTNSIFNNLGNLISAKEKRINILVDKMEATEEDTEDTEDNKKQKLRLEKLVKKEMDDVFLLTEMKDKINNILSIEGKNYFSPEEIDTISQIESQYYRMIMVPSIRQKIDDNFRRQSEIQNGFTNLIQEVDNKWDNAVSEEEIKLFVLNEIKKLFPELHEDEAQNLSNNFYTTITNGKNVRVHLNEHQLNQLKKQKGIEGTCGICMEDFNIEEEVMVLPCDGKHSYHPHCILPWLKMSVNCPMCKCDLREKL